MRLHGRGDWRTDRLRIVAWSAAGALLLVPLVAMQFTDEVAWTLGDFIFAGVLILAVGGAYELAVRKRGDAVYRAAVAVALATGLMLVWSNAAVGIIGSEDNDANLLYAGVLATAIVGTLLARFRPAGMVRALVATACVQALVAAVALLADLDPGIADWRRDLAMITVFFITLWLTSAWLFRRASRA